MKVKHALRLRQGSIYFIGPHTRDGDEFYIVPSGRIDARDALKILERPDVRSFDDGFISRPSITVADAQR